MTVFVCMWRLCMCVVCWCDLFELVGFTESNRFFQGERFIKYTPSIFQWYPAEHGGGRKYHTLTSLRESYLSPSLGSGVSTSE